MKTSQATKKMYNYRIQIFKYFIDDLIDIPLFIIYFFVLNSFLIYLFNHKIKIKYFLGTILIGMRLFKKITEIHIKSKYAIKNFPTLLAFLN
jgi:hypothetical protein